MYNKKSIEQPGKKNTDTNYKKEDHLYYKPFEPEEKEQKKKINPALEKAKEEENIRINLTELADMLNNGIIRTEVLVAGENQSLRIEKILKNGETEKPEDIISSAENINLNKLEAKFKLQWIEGREERLEIDCTLPINRILGGKGDLKKLLNKNITEIFAGTKDHYKNIKEKQEAQKQEQGRLTEPQYKEEKQKIIDSLTKSGALITKLEGEKTLTIIANYPNTDSQIMISIMNRRLPWYIDHVQKQSIERSWVTNQPGEILPEIHKLLTENQ